MSPPFSNPDETPPAGSPTAPTPPVPAPLAVPSGAQHPAFHISGFANHFVQQNTMQLNAGGQYLDPSSTAVNQSLHQNIHANGYGGVFPSMPTGPTYAQSNKRMRVDGASYSQALILDPLPKSPTSWSPPIIDYSHRSTVIVEFDDGTVADLQEVLAFFQHGMKAKEQQDSTFKLEVQTAQQRLFGLYQALQTLSIDVETLKSNAEKIAQPRASTASAALEPPRKVRNTELEKAVSNMCNIKADVVGLRGEDGKMYFPLPHPDRVAGVDGDGHPRHTPIFQIADAKKVPVNIQYFEAVVNGVIHNYPTLAASLSVKEIRAAVEGRFSTLQRTYREQNDEEAKKKKQLTTIQNRRSERKRDKVVRRAGGISGFCESHPDVPPHTIEKFIIKETMSSDESESAENGRVRVFRTNPLPARASWLAKLLYLLDKQEVAALRLTQTFKRQRKPLEGASERPLPAFLPRSVYSTRWMQQSGNTLLPTVNDPVGFDSSKIVIEDSELFPDDLAHVRELEALEAAGLMHGAAAEPAEEITA